MSLRHRLIVLQRAGLCVHTLTAQSTDSIVRVTKVGGYDVVAGGGGVQRQPVTTSVNIVAGHCG